MGLTGVVSKAFLFGFNGTEVHGLQRFLEILESRRDPAKRKTGLITGMMLL
jgi:monolysocardiolipin acyltransferase